MNDQASRGFWWLAAFLSPLLSPFLGLCIGIFRNWEQDDWLGRGALMFAAEALTAGCILSIVFYELSRWRREKYSAVAAVVAWPSIVWLAIIAVPLICRKTALK
jgi:hypothetical protein